MKAVIFDKSGMEVLKLAIFDTFTLTEKLEMSRVPSNIPIFPMKCPMAAPAERVCMGGVSTRIAERCPVWVFQQRLTAGCSPDAGPGDVMVFPLVDARRYIFRKSFRRNELVELVCRGGVKEDSFNVSVGVA